MKHLQLIRIGKSEKGTFGVIKYKELPIAVTLELPWKNNIPFISCIPEQFYMCKRAIRPSTAEAGEPEEFFYVLDVPGGRTGIMFHVVNFTKNLEGCIGVAKSFSNFDQAPGIRGSEIGYNKFMEFLKDDDVFSLEIKDGDI